MLDPDALIGRAISNQCIIETLGSGGMGVVYKAEDSQLDCFVAGKSRAEDFVRDQQARLPSIPSRP